VNPRRGLQRAAAALDDRDVHATTADELIGTRIHAAFVNSSHGRTVDLVLFVGGHTLLLGGCSVEHAPWTEPLTYEVCQRRLVGATITMMARAEGSGWAAVGLDNGVVLVAAVSG
jgi:hypothetical protein